MQEPVRVQPFGRYELLTELARGGMAELFLARLTGVGGFAKLVAIKRILPHLSDDPRFVEMFLAEGRIAAKLSHPNICQVFELGEVEGRLFLAMEYLEGVSWEQLLTAIPRGDLGRLRLTAGVLAQACDGLHYAHELRDPEGRPIGVVHRDVSPQNLFVTVDGVCKVLDFGVAKPTSEAKRTHTGMLKGKLPYMSPEQIEGGAIDARTDVFAAGILVWEALTGERLFLRETDFMIWKAVTSMPIPPVSALAPGLGRDVDAMVARALERDPARRYPTIAVFGDELRHVARAFGGPAGAGEVGALVRSAFAPELAERARRVHDASGQPIDPHADTFAAEATTSDVALRGASVTLGRPARRRWPVAVLAGAVVLGAGIAWVVHAHRLAHAAGAPRDAAVLAAAAPADAAAPARALDAAADADEPPEVELPDAGPAAPPAHHAVAHRPAEPGFYSVDSRPYATIYIDGKRRDQTPLFHVRLAPGRHVVRAVLADGRHRTFAIRIEPGEDASSGTLSW